MKKLFAALDSGIRRIVRSKHWRWWLLGLLLLNLWGGVQTIVSKKIGWATGGSLALSFFVVGMLAEAIWYRPILDKYRELTDGLIDMNSRLLNEKFYPGFVDEITKKV